MASVKVKGYTYKLGSKTVKVKAHTRTVHRKGGRRKATGRHVPLHKAFKESARAMRRRAPRKRRFSNGTKGRRR